MFSLHFRYLTLGPFFLSLSIPLNKGETKCKSLLYIKLYFINKHTPTYIGSDWLQHTSTIEITKHYFILLCLGRMILHFSNLKNKSLWPASAFYATTCNLMSRRQSAKGRYHLKIKVSWQHAPNIHALSRCLPSDREQDKLKSLRLFLLSHFIFIQPPLHMLLCNFCGSRFYPFKRRKDSLILN